MSKAEKQAFEVISEAIVSFFDSGMKKEGETERVISHGCHFIVDIVGVFQALTRIPVDGFFVFMQWSKVNILP